MKKVLAASVLAGLVACGPMQEGATGNDEGVAQSQEGLGQDLNTNPTAWSWYYGQTVSQVSSLLSAQGARLVSLQVEQVSPLLVTVAMVKNTGTYAKSWWWFVDQTAAQLSSQIQSLNARIVNIQAYERNGQTLFAAVLLSNTGADAKGWWWYYGLSSTSQVTSLLQQNNARLIDVDEYSTAAGKRFAVVMIPNTGADAKSWWWYVGATPSQIATYLQQNQAVITDIEPSDASGTTFNVVMEKTGGFLWWWYYGLTASQLSDRLSQNGARLYNVESYNTASGRRFVAVMINDSNAETTRVGQLLRNGTDGETGLYLKAAGGGALANLQGSRVFEPASSIKITIAYHAFKQIEAGNASLLDSVPIYAAPASGSCPTNTVIGSETMGNAMLKMLENSDNQRTRAMIDHFGGFSPINNTAHAAGMSSTNLNHYPGCGGPVANQLTLSDAALLYDGIARKTLINSTSQAALYARMPANAGDFTGIQGAVQTIVSQEGAALGLSGSQISAYQAKVATHYKAGGYTLCGSGTCLEYRSVAGNADLPVCTGGVKASTTYEFGIFIDGSTSATNANNTFNATKAELLREPIRTALQTWASCVP